LAFINGFLLFSFVLMSSAVPWFFVFSWGVYMFNGIQASFAGLFDAKKKEPFGGGEPRQDRDVAMIIATHSYFFL